MDKRKIIKDYILYDYDVNYDTISECHWEDGESKRKYITNLASEIGWIIIEFSSLENKLDTTLYFNLVESSENKEIIYSLISKKSYSEKVDLLNNMYKINYEKNPDCYKKIFEDFPKSLNEIIADLKAVGQIRNNYAHSIFSNVNEAKLVERKTKLTSQGIQKEFLKFDYIDIDSDFEKIFEVGNKLSLFNEKTWDCFGKESTKAPSFKICTHA